jgi:hypothetical protein
MDQALLALYHRHVAAAFDRQMRLADFLEKEAGGQRWNYTISTATLEFGDKVRFEAFDIGTHADPDNSWLWAWCNPHLKLTEANHALGEAVRQLGQDVGVAAFAADRQLSCGDLLGPDVSPAAAHAFAAIVVGELQFDAYYTIPFTHGRATAVIRDKRLQSHVPNPVARIVTVFPQALAAFPIPDHEAAFVAYAKWYDLTIEKTPGIMHVLSHGKRALKATFDNRKRLTELEGTVSK